MTRIGDLIDDAAKKQRATRWGKWEYRASNQTLVCHVDDAYEYEIDLEQCTTAKRVLHWIMHIREKTWCTAEVAADMLAAIEAILRPRATLCEAGQR